MNDYLAFLGSHFPEFKKLSMYLSLQSWIDFAKRLRLASRALDRYLHPNNNSSISFEFFETGSIDSGAGSLGAKGSFLDLNFMGFVAVWNGDFSSEAFWTCGLEYLMGVFENLGWIFSLLVDVLWLEFLGWKSRFLWDEPWTGAFMVRPWEFLIANGDFWLRLLSILELDLNFAGDWSLFPRPTFEFYRGIGRPGNQTI
jgi:hypothetical protein